MFKIFIIIRYLMILDPSTMEPLIETFVKEDSSYKTQIECQVDVPDTIEKMQQTVIPKIIESKGPIQYQVVCSIIPENKPAEFEI